MPPEGKPKRLEITAPGLANPGATSENEKSPTERLNARWGGYVYTRATVVSFFDLKSTSLEVYIERCELPTVGISP